MRIKVFILIGLSLLLFALDFVPVKFAQKGTDIVIDNEKYVFCYEPKTLGNEIVNWIAYGYNDNKIDFDLSFQVSISGENPYNYLAEQDFEPIDLYNSTLGSNKFVLKGDIKKNTDSETEINIMVDRWDIVYPINRLSVRRFYVPKNYLTIYDYDWLQVMKNCGMVSDRGTVQDH